MVLTSFDQARAVVITAERAHDMSGVLELAAEEIVASYVACALDGDRPATHTIEDVFIES